MNTAVIYKSNYGATKRYAEWIAEELCCPVFDLAQIKPDELNTYDLIIYGGGMYAGSIAGAKQIVKNFHKQLVIFAVGLSDPADANISEIAKQNVLSDTKLFVFQGGYEFDKLSVPHKLIMRVVRKAMGNKPGMTAEEKAAMYENVLDFTDHSAITPLMEYVKNSFDK